MPANLLERDQFLLTLDEALLQATEGHGRIALVSGEAGIGKTSLVECFLERHHSAARILWGACEALFTPRPLGPLYDIAQQTQNPLRSLLEGEASRTTLFAAVLDDLTRGPLPTVVVIEDIHWADESTLDLIKFLARRIHRIPALLIVTYRYEELGRDHPLRLVLGDLPARDVTRLRLPPLSEAAVATLAQHADRPAKNLYLATSGNPFFLAEVLASDAPGVPASVSDAVLVQVARRSPEAQELLEVVAVVPNRVEWWVVEAVGGFQEESAALEECLAVGMLHIENGTVGFRHELARLAVEGKLAPARKRALHAQVLQILLDRADGRAPLAQLVHHALQAGDGIHVLRFAPAAAKQASAQGAHREAVEQYRTALNFADSLEDDQRAELLEGLAYECVLTGQMHAAIRASEDAMAIWRELGMPQRVGHDLRWLSRVYWYIGQNAEADRYVEAAVQLLETLPPGGELIWAYNYRAMLAMLAEETADAQVWSSRAIELIDQYGDIETHIHALNTLGMARLFAGDLQGRDLVDQSLQLALEHGFEEHVGRACSNLACYFVRYRDYASADHYLSIGTAYCADRDLEVYAHQMTSWRALALLDQGNWTSACEDANTVVGAHRVLEINKIQALVALGLVRARRGDPGSAPLLDEARDLALSTGELQRITPIMAGRAEVAWLRGDLAQCAAEARVGFDLACRHTNPWALGQLAYWLWRAGALPEFPSGIAAPYALQIAGDWQAAATAWKQIGSPYEQAVALMDGDEPAQRAALEIFERLGGAPAAELVRKCLRAIGARGLARGPRLSTRANPQGLTSRQLEILLLLAEGLHNSEIADQLSTTPKTVEHHVSAVLAKLGVRSRAEAVHVAYQLGLLPESTQTRQTVSPITNKIGV